MAALTARKAQVVLSQHQYGLLEAYARQEGKAVSSVVREVLERTLLATLERQRREAALLRLRNQKLPVTDWPTMEREIESMWLENDAPA